MFFNSSMRESRLTYGNQRLLKVSQHSRLFNRYGRGEHYFPLSKTSFIESEVKPMKSRCAPMSAEDRQAHHLFISHHCRITARCLPRLVARFVVLDTITKPSLFPPLVFVLLVVSVPFAFPIPDFPKPRLSLHHPKPSLFPPRIRPISRICPIQHHDTRFSETSAHFS